MTELSEGAARPLIETTGESRRPTGLLLVAIPVLLMAWLIIWPIFSAIGRTIWRQPFEAWLEDQNDEAFVREVAAGYARFIDVWRQARLSLARSSP